MNGQPPRGIALSPGAARKIGGATSRVRRSAYLPAGQQPATDMSGWNPGIIRAVVTVAIPTGTIGTPSTTGMATLYAWDANDETSEAEETRDDVRVCNDMTISASVPIGTVVKLGWNSGDFWLVSSECF